VLAGIKFRLGYYQGEMSLKGSEACASRHTAEEVLPDARQHTEAPRATAAAKASATTSTASIAAKGGLSLSTSFR
jgi:hypothetical protein